MKKICIFIILFFCVYGVASFFNDYIAQYEEIQGKSMEPAFQDGDHTLISQLPFFFSEPQRFDIIAFSWEHELYVKRIIGLPGEIVAIKDGNIYINGQILPENYGKEEMNDTLEPMHLKENEYFVLGDNRNFSEDSRSKDMGAITKEQIKGKVLFK